MPTWEETKESLRNQEEFLVNLTVHTQKYKTALSKAVWCVLYWEQSKQTLEQGNWD